MRDVQVAFTSRALYSVRSSSFVLSFATVHLFLSEQALLLCLFLSFVERLKL